MKIIEVTDKKLAAQWINFPKRLYRHDTNWICPLDLEIQGIFDPQSNLCFAYGEAARWILINDSGEIIGRIAAFIDRRKVNHFDYPTGNAGFFECKNDQEAANMLFDTAKNWLAARGMEAMQAPVNFGENYMHWGLLVEGFQPQGYGMPYNFPYYQQLFESYGFRNYFSQLSFHKVLSEGFSERMWKFAEYTASRPGYSFEHFSFQRIDKYISDFVFTYNAVWSKFHVGYTPLKDQEIRQLVEGSKMVLDEELIWFAYDQGKPVGLMVVFPDINQILVKLKNGKLNLINKLKLLFYRRRAISRTRVLMFGILPEYQNTGIVAALFQQLVKVLQNKPRHKEIELSWVGDYNPRMIGVYEKIGAVPAKKHITYMYLFNNDAVFRRFDNQFEGKLY